MEIVARYSHPQGSTIVVYDNDAVVKTNPAGRVVSTSATAEKLRAGHGGWTPLTDDAPAVTAPLPKAKATTKVIVAPMKFKQAELTDLHLYVTNDAWALQQKLDGVRAQIVFDGGKPWFRNSTGGRLESAVAHAVTNPLAAMLPVHPDDAQGYVVDGEVVGGLFWAFDLIMDGGEREPFADRLTALQSWRAALLQHNPKVTSLVRVLPTALSMDDKARLAEAVHTQGGEGWIAKRLDSTYDWGQRVEHSLKVKITHTVDVVVMDRNRESKSNFVVGVYRDGTLSEVGCASAIGKPDAKVGDVVEVKYLYASTDGRLTQPTVVRRRDDKNANECTFDQLRFADKSVVCSA